MDKHITWLDSPTDIMVSKYTSASELKPYIGSFFKIRSAVFILCMEGTIECSLNSSECIIKQHNVITLVPNSFVEVHTISPDIELYLVAFSSDFMGCVNYIRSTMNCITYIYPETDHACSCKHGLSVQRLLWRFIRIYHPSAYGGQQRDDKSYFHDLQPRDRRAIQKKRAIG